MGNLGNRMQEAMDETKYSTQVQGRTEKRETMSMNEQPKDTGASVSANKAKSRERSLANLKPFQPGQSGNPSGRPKRTPLSDACREVLALPVPNDPQGRTYAQKIAATLADKAAEGDVRAGQELADRAEGKARQSIEIENTRLREAFDRMSREEMEAYAVSGVLPEWFSNDETVQ
jgi:Family of unknown function (DUF5681)